MRVIQERNENNTPQVTYTRGLDLAGSWERAGGIGGLLARTAHSGANGVTYTPAFYHADGNGNVTYLLKLDQTAGANYQFDPFGRLLASSGTLAAANTYRFSSKEVMLASGFYSFGYRFYDPATQRWLNRDPIGEEGGVNLYGYVGNNPLTYWDAFGNDPQSNMSLLKDELGGDSYDGTVCDRFTQFASDVLNETPIGQAKIALTGKNLQDEQVSLLEQISTAAGPVLGMCKKICGMARAANGGARTIANTLPKGVTDIKNAKGEVFKSVHTPPSIPNAEIDFHTHPNYRNVLPDGTTRSGVSKGANEMSRQDIIDAVRIGGQRTGGQ
jgi:RHS repeat-associated protein